MNAAKGRPPHKRGPYSFYNVLSEPVDIHDKDSLKREFGRRLAEAMDEKGWNQSELARRSNEWLPRPAKGQKQGDQIGRDAISNYIRGEHLPRPTYLRAIARALSVQPSDLMPSNVPSVGFTKPEFSMQSAGPGKVRAQVDIELPMELVAEFAALIRKAKQQ